VKVAVAAQGADWSSPVDTQFGRARRFLIVDLPSGTSSVYENAGCRRTGHTAGMQAAGVLMSLGVKAVIAGNIGPKAFATLHAGQVDVYRFPGGTVREAIEKFKVGGLPSLEGASVEEHSRQLQKSRHSSDRMRSRS